MSSYVFDTRAELDKAVSAWINNKTEATSTYGDINTWDVSGIKDFSELFRIDWWKTYFNSDISNWNVSNGTNFSYMFSDTTFNQDISSWDVSNGTNFKGMFARSEFGSNYGIYQPKYHDISNWDVSNGTDFSYMFQDTYVHSKLGNWDVSNGTNFQGMFYEASFDNDIGIGNWNVSNGTNFSYMFVDSTFNQDISSWDVSNGTNFKKMLRTTRFKQDVSNWDVSNGTNFAEMFGSGEPDNIYLWNLSSLDMSEHRHTVNGLEIKSLSNMLSRSYGTPQYSDFLGKTFKGTSSNDEISGGVGNDVFNSSEGNDDIKGESGTDTYIFSSNRKDYEIINLSSYLTIVDLRDGSPDGTDNLYSIEKLKFSGAIYSTSDLFLNPANHSIGTNYTLVDIRDYEGNLHAKSGIVSNDTKTSYKYQGLIDVNADGTKEAIYTNKESGRWVTGSINISGEIDYSDHGQGGTTRVVGIYIDPLVISREVEQFGPHDSQRRFQNDLLIDNLTVKTSGDYDGDGFQEVYWKTNDGSAYLRALMHADANIQYANYQSESQMSDYLTSNGYESVISEIV